MQMYRQARASRCVLWIAQRKSLMECRFCSLLVLYLDYLRLDCANMRPVVTDDDHFLMRYLMKDDDAAELQGKEEVVYISSHPFPSIPA